MNDGTGDKILLQTNGVSSFHGMITTHGGIDVTSGTVGIIHPGAELNIGTGTNDINATIDKDGTSTFNGAMTVNNTLTVGTNHRTTLNGGLTIPAGQTGSFLGVTEFESTSSFGDIMTVNSNLAMTNGSFSMNDGTGDKILLQTDGVSSFHGTLTAHAINCTGVNGFLDIYSTNTGLRVGTSDNNYNVTINEVGDSSFAGTMHIGGASTTGDNILSINGDTTWNYNGNGGGSPERCKLTVGSSNNDSELLIRGSIFVNNGNNTNACLLYTSPSPRDRQKSRMPSSA